MEKCILLKMLLKNDFDYLINVMGYYGLLELLEGDLLFDIYLDIVIVFLWDSFF